MFKINHYLILLLLFFIIPVHAADKPKSIKKQTIADNYLTAKEAYDLKHQQGAKLLFVDIRSPSELVFVGAPQNMDINIPFLTLDFKHWDSHSGSFKKVPNQHFLSAIDDVIHSKKLNKQSPMILLCRSGKRSAKAANLLTSAGYSNVYTIVEGFEGDKAKQGHDKGKRTVNGWKNAGLPWGYKLDKSHLSLNQNY